MKGEFDKGRGGQAIKVTTKVLESLLSPWRMRWDHELEEISDLRLEISEEEKEEDWTVHGKLQWFEYHALGS